MIPHLETVYLFPASIYNEVRLSDDHSVDQESFVDERLEPVSTTTDAFQIVGSVLAEVGYPVPLTVRIAVELPWI